MDSGLDGERRSKLKQEYGFIGSKDVQRHEDRLGVRQVQTEYVGTIAEELMRIATSIKHQRVEVSQRVVGSTVPNNSLKVGQSLTLINECRRIFASVSF